MSVAIESAPRQRAREERTDAVALVIAPDVHLHISPEDFWRLCAANPDLRLEREASGELTVVPPAGSDSGCRNAGITGQLWYWNEQTKLGVVFDSSVGFTLPNTAVRGPDTAWMTAERWAALPVAERRRFAEICPDFVVELASPSDDRDKLGKKMEEYLAQGIRLGWLIDPDRGTVDIYRPGRPVERLVKPATLSGDDVLPGFVLELKGILYD
jgi:Uma2 family endonuclease